MQRAVEEGEGARVRHAGAFGVEHLGVDLAIERMPGGIGEGFGRGHLLPMQLHVSGWNAAVALANKIARMAWAMMVRGERFKEPTMLPAVA